MDGPIPKLLKHDKPKILREHIDLLETYTMNIRIF
jgi:hypothetical protein